jgi:hypothetical protein
LLELQIILAFVRWRMQSKVHSWVKKSILSLSSLSDRLW